MRPSEKDPSIFAVHDPRIFEIAKSGFFCDKEETTTASCL
jgi:hypothetical protein